MDIKVVEQNISIEELKKLAREFYISMIKGVVDIENEIVAFGGEFHMDANIVLLDKGSKQSNIWGFNLHFDKSRDSWIEYTSLINIRPAQNNRDIEVSDDNIRFKMKEIINSIIK